MNETIDAMMATVFRTNKSNKMDAQIYKSWLDSFNESEKEFLILKGIKDGRIS